MAIADKLVLQRQRHLKWLAFDKLELALMIVCGVLCFGFSLSVTADIVTRTIGHPCHRHQRSDRSVAVSSPVILGLMTFCFLFFGYLGVPVPFSLLAGVFVGAMLTDVSLAAIIQKVFDGVDSEALLAIPFFLLVGELMSSANVVVRIANLSLSLVGHIRGGLSQVLVVFSMFFSEMSGSTTADVAVMSRALGGPMGREGYEPAFTAAIIASASTIAALVPPSITAVVYGAVGNVSIAGLFMAGGGPGVF